MAFGLVQNKPADAVGTNPTATFTSTPTTGNLLVAVIGTNENTPASLTNPTGWTQRGEKSTGTGTGLVRILSRISDGTEGAVTWTDATNRTYIIELFEWSGNQPSGSEFDAVSAGANGVGTSLQPGSITPNQTAELFVAVDYAGSNVVTSPAISSGFTLVDTATITHGEVGYKIKTDAVAENPTFSWTGSQSHVAIQAAFKSALPVAAKPPRFSMSQAVHRAAVR